MNSSRKAFFSGLILGLAAVVTSLFFSLAIPSAAVPFGTLFLFIASSTLGMAGSLLAACVGLLPEVIYTEAYFYGSRVLTACLAISYCADRFPKVPSYIIVFALWLVYFFVLLLSVFFPETLGFSFQSSSYQSFVLQAIGEVFTASLSSVLLLTPQLWTALSPRQRVLNSHQVLGPLSCALSCGTAIVILTPLITTTANGKIGHDLPADYLFFVLIAATIIPTYLGWHTAKFLRNLPDIGILSRPANQNIASDELTWDETETAEPVEQPTRQRKRKPTGRAREEEGICAVTPHGNIAHINKTFRSFSQIRDEDVSEKSFHTINMDPELKKLLLQVMEQTPLEGNHTSEYRREEGPNKHRFFLIQLQKYKKDQAQTITLRDITDQRTIERHLLQSQKMSSLGSIVSGIAHAFNNALTNIIGQASFAQRTSDKQVLEKALDDIIRSANQAGELVWSLLDFAEGRPSLMEPIDMQSLVDERLPFIQKLVGEQYELIFQGSIQPLGVDCDSHLVIQLISNLVMNAKESYGGKPGKIHLSLSMEDMDETVARLHQGARPGEFVRLRIEDFGSGMTPEILEKAFDPLYSTKQDDGHSGLGLSVVYAILRAHDGFLSVESFPDKGTSLSLYFPHVTLAATQEEDQKEEEQGQGKNHTPQETKILVVEDEPSVRTLLSKMLGTLGYQVETCNNGEEALRLSEQKDFDLILTDLMMPKMSGSELATKIREKDDGIRVVIMSGHGPNAQLEKDSQEILAKPFDIDTLSQRIRAAFEEAQV